MVKNSRGLENSVKKKFWVYHQNQPPVAGFSVSTYGGNTKTNFRFDSWNCYDPEDSPTEMTTRWDFENDGIWDTELMYEKEMYHYFESPGEYVVAMEVVDRGGLTDIKYETIYVSDNDYETGILLDKRGNSLNYYGTIKIGNQWWFSSNLSVNNKYFFGNWDYNGSDIYVAFYGSLYPFGYLPSDCPDGWRVPSQADWEELFEALPTNDYYQELVLGGRSGFNAIFGGLNDGSKMPNVGRDRGKFGYYWSNTKLSGTNAMSVWVVTFDKAKQKVLPGFSPENLYYSVRCVRN